MLGARGRLSGSLLPVLALCLSGAVGGQTPPPAPGAISFTVPPQPGANEGTYDTGTAQRTFLLALPESRPGSRPPLLVALHGTGGKVGGYFSGKFSTLVDYALAEGWIVVLPQALENAATGKIQWNTVWPHVAGPEDVAFIGGLVVALNEEIGIDGERVYLAGFSGGGTFAQLLAAVRPELYAAVATVGGSFSALASSGNLVLLPPAEGPMPVFIGHGGSEEDHETKRPYDGGPNDSGTMISPVWEQVDYWARANGCRPEPRIQWPPLEERPPDKAYEGFPRVEHYTECDGETEVVFVTAVGARHDWFRAGAIQFDGDRMIVDFLARH